MLLQTYWWIEIYLLWSDFIALRIISIKLTTQSQQLLQNISTQATFIKIHFRSNTKLGGSSEDILEVISFRQWPRPLQLQLVSSKHTLKSTGLAAVIWSALTLVNAKQQLRCDLSSLVSPHMHHLALTKWYSLDCYTAGVYHRLALALVAFYCMIVIHRTSHNAVRDCDIITVVPDVYAYLHIILCKSTSNS